MITKIGYRFFDFELRFLMKSQHKTSFKMSGHLTCSDNFVHSAYFGRNSEKLIIYRTEKPNFSGPSNNGLSLSEVKPSILKSAYSTTLSLYTIKDENMKDISLLRI